MTLCDHTNQRIQIEIPSVQLLRYAFQSSYLIQTKLLLFRFVYRFRSLKLCAIFTHTQTENYS